MTKILDSRKNYKPFEYPVFFDLFTKHEQMHWLPTEAQVQEDVNDWKSKMTEDEKAMVKHLFRFFTTADVDVMEGYDVLLSVFKHPEIQQVLSSIAAREAVHVWGYSLLLETLGMEDSEFSAFLKEKSMSDKHDFLQGFSVRDDAGEVDVKELAKYLAVIGAFTEGVQLFSTFAILFNFTRFGKLKGTGQIVAWSIKDEDIHVQTCVELFKKVVYENDLDMDIIHGHVVSIGKRMVELEDAFIDDAFNVANDNIEGLTRGGLKEYIRYLCNERVKQLFGESTPDVFPGAKNTLDWLVPLVYGAAHTNFFENREVEYAKGAIDFKEQTEW
jgi:ribonucleoside-diphosphate reductase beta chain